MRSTLSKQIIERHRESLRGRLRHRYLASAALGLRKAFYVYEPPGLDRSEPVPVVWLFRGHQREWVNVGEDASRTRTTIEDIDLLIHRGVLPPLVAVMPGLNSSNNHVPSLGIDMVGPWKQSLQGLGTGRFWAYLTGELMPRIECDYTVSTRLAAGFSLGGYTASLLAAMRPGWFDVVALYDALFMWPDHQDPRYDAADRYSDPVWGRAGIFDAALGKPRDPAALDRWNPTDAISRADAGTLARLRTTRFWVRSAAADGNRGNLDRNCFFIEHLRDHGIPVANREVVLHPKARHTWHWTDHFLVKVLKRELNR